MNSELVMKILEWEKWQRAADAIKAEIEAELLASESGSTQVGDVKVRLVRGRKSYGSGAWESLAIDHLTPQQLEEYYEVKPNYREACKANGLEPEYTVGPDHFKFTLLEKKEQT